MKRGISLWAWPLLGVLASACRTVHPVTGEPYRIVGIEAAWQHRDRVVLACAVAPACRTGFTSVALSSPSGEEDARDQLYTVLPLDLCALPAPMTRATFVDLGRTGFRTSPPAASVAEAPPLLLQPTVMQGSPPQRLEGVPEGLSVYLSDAAEGGLAATWRVGGFALLGQFGLPLRLWGPSDAGGSEADSGDDALGTFFLFTHGAILWLTRPNRRGSGDTWELERAMASGDSLAILLRGSSAASGAAQGSECHALLRPPVPPVPQDLAVVQTVCISATPGSLTPAMLALGRPVAFTLHSAPAPGPAPAIEEGIHAYTEPDSGAVRVVVRHGERTVGYVITKGRDGAKRLTWRWLLAPVVVPGAIVGDLGAFIAMAPAGMGY